MLSPKQEAYCKARAKGMSQIDAYISVYSVREGRKKSGVYRDASLLEDNPKIIQRINELKKTIDDKFTSKIVWNKETAFNDLEWLKNKAKKEVEQTGALSAPCVSAITKAVEMQNDMYGVGAQESKGGVLGDILHAVKGIRHDRV